MVTFLGIVCLIALMLSLHSCVSYSSFQTAQTTEKGQIAGTAGFGYNEEGEEFYYDLGIRYGFSDSVDIGFKYNRTIDGGTLVLADAKMEVRTKTPGFYQAVGFGVSPIFNQQEGLAFHAPYYASFETIGKKLTFNINPRAIYLIDMRENPENSNTGLGFGGTVGFKIGKKVSIMPEFSILGGQYDGKFEINNFMSVGLGINVR